MSGGEGMGVSWEGQMCREAGWCGVGILGTFDSPTSWACCP